MSGNGLYVYGLMRSAQARALGRVGLEHEGAPAPVYPVAVDGVAAIVSAWHPSRQVVPLRRHLEPHHGVIRSLGALATIVPMTFGHVARSRRELERLLRAHAHAIGQHVAGKARLSDGPEQCGLNGKLDLCMLRPLCRHGVRHPVVELPAALLSLGPDQELVDRHSPLCQRAAHG